MADEESSANSRGGFAVLKELEEVTTAPAGKSAVMGAGGRNVDWTNASFLCMSSEAAAEGSLLFSLPFCRKHNDYLLILGSLLFSAAAFEP